MGKKWGQHPGGSPQLGAIVARHREKKGITQYALAHAAGMSPSSLSRIESGQRGMSLGAAARLATLLGDDFLLDVRALLGVQP